MNWSNFTPSNLTERSTAFDGAPNIQKSGSSSSQQRSERMLSRVHLEVFRNSLSVDQELATSLLQPNTSNTGFSLACTVHPTKLVDVFIICKNLMVCLLGTFLNFLRSTDCNI